MSQRESSIGMSEISLHVLYCTYSLTLKVGATPIGPLLLNAAINNNNNNNKITPTTSLPKAGVL